MGSSWSSQLDVGNQPMKDHNVNVRITGVMHRQIVKIIGARMIRTGKQGSIGGWVRQLVDKELKEVTDVKEYRL